MHGQRHRPGSADADASDSGDTGGAHPTCDRDERARDTPIPSGDPVEDIWASEYGVWLGGVCDACAGQEALRQAPESGAPLDLWRRTHSGHAGDAHHDQHSLDPLQEPRAQRALPVAVQPRTRGLPERARVADGDDAAGQGISTAASGLAQPAVEAAEELATLPTAPLGHNSQIRPNSVRQHRAAGHMAHGGD
jgi:hypothetical protein